MKKLLLTCLALTVSSLLLWWFSQAKTFTYPPMQANEQTTIKNDALRTFYLDKLLGNETIEIKSADNDILPQNPPPILALTFDDGPSQDTTPLLLAGLRERGVQVTFFILGTRAAKAPDIVLMAYEDGHALGGHSYDHRSYFTKLNTSSLQTQLQKTDDIIANITGEKPPILLRPPYGAINASVAQQTAKANILWSIDPRDWETRDSEIIYSYIIENAQDGGVVILHDIYPTTVEGTLKAIDKLLAKGWIFVTIPQLYEAYNIPLQAGGIYRSPHNYTLPE